MSLSSSEAIRIVQAPTNHQKVRSGAKYESRIRLLTEAYDSETIEKQSAWQEVKNYLRGTLTTDKYEAIMKYWTFPLSGVNISNDMLSDLFYVFNARNTSFEIQYPNSRLNEASEAMLSNLGVRRWIEDNGKKVLKCAPNSLTIVDIDGDGNPALILVQNEQLLGYELKEDGSFEYVIFQHSKGKDSIGEWSKIALYDSEFYRVYIVRNGLYKIDVESAHKLDYCPAMFFYDKPLTSKHEFDRSIPLSNTLGILYQWQIFETFLFYAQHYGTFPAMEYADNGCEVSGCEGGIIVSAAMYNGDEIIGYSQPTACPSCSKKGLIGPGTAIGIEVSDDKDIQDTRGILRFVTPDTTSLEYIGKMQAAKENFIKVNTVGYANGLTGQPVNELQVRSLLESRRKPLLEIKQHLEKLYKFIVKTSIKLMYNVEVNVSCDYGTEYFILTESDILLLIQEAKKAGVQSAEIWELNKMLIETKYKNDPYKVQRMTIASDIEPSPFDTREEVLSKKTSGMISREDYFIKLNFIDLLKRFERENGSIVSFGTELLYAKKIDKIKQTLLFYTKQMLPDEQISSEQVQPSGKGISDN